MKLFGGSSQRAVERSEPVFETPRPRAEGTEIKLSDLERWEDLWGGASAAGPVVNAKTAMRSTAVYACVQLIAGAVGSLPLHVFQRTPEARERLEDHPAALLFNEAPNELMTSGVFREFVMQQILLKGDSVSAIMRRNSGAVVEILPFDMNHVAIEKRQGRFRYRFTPEEGQQFSLDQDDVLHVPGIGFNPRTGRSLSPIQHAARNAVGVQIAADEYSARFFANDAAPRGVLRFPGKVNEELLKEIRAAWERTYGGTENAHKVGILTEGAEWQSVTMNAEDAQLMESRQFQIEDIARAYGVPPHMIGAMQKTTAWGTGVEQLTIAFVMFTLGPHLRRIEQEIDRKIIREPDQFAEHNETALLRGDSKARGDFYRQGLGGSQGPGWMTVNEVRKRENLAPITGGDSLMAFPLSAAGGQQEDGNNASS